MKRYLFIALVFSFGTLSCEKDVLDKQPLDMISDNDVWGDPALIDGYLTQAYAQTYVFLNETWGNDWDTGASWAAPYAINEISDECLNNWWVGSSAGYSYKHGRLTINGGLLEWWENAYNVIRILNVFIERTQNLAGIDEAFIKQRTAEARFLRAFNYFSMVKRYGGIPLITVPQPLDAPNEDLYPKRNTEQELYDFILAEMDGIVADLSENSSGQNYGRPSKYAALALKSRAALYAASISRFGTVRIDGVVGIDLSKAELYYQTAFDAAKEILDGGPFSLYRAHADKATNFRNLFLEKNNSEVIFVRPHTFSDRDQGGNGWSYDFFQTPAPNAWGAGNCSAPYLEMVESFEYIDGRSGRLDRDKLEQGLWDAEELWLNKDPRFFASIYTLQTFWQGDRLRWHNGLILPNGTLLTEGSYNGVLALGDQRVDGVFGSGFGVLKYLDETKNNMGERGTSGTDWIVFRLGEIYLNYAEAAFELGRAGEALLAINEIRDRAGIALLSGVDRVKIQNERKVELAFEGHRYWDVRRWRTATSDLSVNGSGLRYMLDYNTRKYKISVVENIDGTVAVPAFYDRNYYLPITLARTGNNPNLVENPGYQN